MKNQILIVDLEASCWENNPPKGQVSEIIEIGFCLLNIKTGVVSNSNSILVKPQRSTISPFCVDLTGITQDMVDNNGLPFQEACKKLQEEYNVEQYPWASYGLYDLKQVRTQCTESKIQYPFSHVHINVKNFFYKLKKLDRPVNMKNALKMLGMSLDGSHHRGMDDAKNIAKILYWCLQ